MITGGELVVAAANGVEDWQHAMGPQTPPSSRKVAELSAATWFGPISPEREAIRLGAAAEELDLEAPLDHWTRLADELIQALVG
jgi:hypothetical protein